MKKLTLLLLLCLVSLPTLAKKEYNNWYFGKNAGITFNTPDGVPIALTDGELSTDEGCATYSDTNGKLLFYTDGRYVWNKNHQLMSNGSGLSGDTSSTQSAMIVPIPLKESQYYIFTVSAITGETGLGLCYSIVDLNLNSGLGEITTKNHQLAPYAREKLACIENLDGSGFWILSFESQSNEYLAYEITESGVSKTPVISKCELTFPLFELSHCIGSMKFSHDGKLLASAFYTAGIIDLFNFDRSTGKLSNQRLAADAETLGLYTMYAYGLEFSPNSNSLFCSIIPDPITGRSLLIQCLLSGDDNVSIDSIIKFPDDIPLANLQMGPDRKIYVATGNTNSMGVINNPDLKYPQCDFVENEVSLNTAICMYGLTSMIVRVPDCNYDVTFSSESYKICKGDSTLIEAIPNISGDYTFLWSTNENTSSIIVTDSGSYKVIISNEFGCEKSAEIFIDIHPVLETGINSNNITGICIGDSLELSATPGDQTYTYLWSTGEVNSTIVVSDPGLYKVWIESENGCRDSSEISIGLNPTLSLKVKKTNSSIADKNTILTVTVNSANKETFEIDNLLVNLVFDAKSFLPDSNQSFIIENYVDYKQMRHLTLESDNLTIKDNEKEIFRIKGMPLLTEKLEFVINVADIELPGSDICTVSENGLLVLDSSVCAFDLRSVIAFKPVQIQMSPNPASNTIQLDVTGDHEGLFTLSIRNIQGVKVAQRTWNHKKGSKDIFSQSLINLSNGVYQVILKTNSKVISKPLLIVK